MSDEKIQEYKQCIYDAIDGCVGHLSIALQELGNHREFEYLKHDIQMIFNEAKRIKRGIEDNE